MFGEVAKPPASRCSLGGPNITRSPRQVRWRQPESSIELQRLPRTYPGYLPYQTQHESSSDVAATVCGRIDRRSSSSSFSATNPSARHFGFPCLFGTGDCPDAERGGSYPVLGRWLAPTAWLVEVALTLDSAVGISNVVEW